MPHYDSYNSFKTKKSIDKKTKAKEKTLTKNRTLNNDFIIDTCKDYGIIIEVKYNKAYVLYDNKIIEAKLKNNVNLICNQILFPGDKVAIDKVNSSFVITNMLSRISLLSRVKKDSTRMNNSVGLIRNIAANVTLAVIVVSAKEPPLHPKFIDRYLMILQNSDIDAIICLNKCDLKTEVEENILNIYRKINIPIVETSTYTKKGIEELKSYLKGKQAIFVGNSGVGKSSLANAMMDDEDIKTGHISQKSKRGRHTTTTSKYYVWDDSSSIIDTPGIRSLDVSSFDAREIQDYFYEFTNFKEKCKYKDCLHYNEPEEICFVKQKVTNGEISKERYLSYTRILDSLVSEKN